MSVMLNANPHEMILRFVYGDIYLQAFLDVLIDFDVVVG